MQRPSAPERKDKPSSSFFDSTRNRIAMLAMVGASLLPTCKTANPKHMGWGQDEWGNSDGWGKDEWGNSGWGKDDWSGGGDEKKVVEKEKINNGSVLEVSENHFRAEVLDVRGKPVLVDFWASWCKPCEKQAPIIKELAGSLGDKVKFVKIDFDKNKALAAALGVPAIPALAIFKDGQAVYARTGLHSKAVLFEELKKHIEKPPTNLAAGLMNLDQARQYAIIIVNRDRIKQGLNPVVHDAIATKAGQRHVEDMAKNGFTAHWGTDGSVPEQRYTEAGGEDFVMENARCLGGGLKSQIDPNQMFSKAQIEEAQLDLMNSPGHKKNILMPTHNRLGIGLAIPLGSNVACMTQEFVDDYGTYGKLPAQATVGQQITVSGQVKGPFAIGGVGISRIDPAAPTPPAKLKPIPYSIPSTYIGFFPQGFKTPKPITVQGNQFTIDVPLDDKKRPGRYGVSVWGALPGQSNLRMISLRTIDVR